MELINSTTLHNESNITVIHQSINPEFIMFDSTNGIIAPCLTFSLGVFGNGLAIVSLLMYKYRKVQPHSPELYTANLSPSSRIRQSIAVDNTKHRSISPFSGRKGNIGTLVPRRRRRNKSFGPFHTLVLALISIDFLGSVMTSPVTLHLYTTNTTIKEAGGDVLCNYSAFTMMFLGVVTMASLTIMAIERVICIQFPFFYDRKINTKTALIAIVLIVVACAAFSALPLFGFGKIRSMYPNTWCFADWHAHETKDMAFNYLYATIGMMLILTTLICNIFAVIALIKMKIRMSSQKVHRESMGLETQTIIQLIVMTCIYLLCWLPLMVRIFVNQLTKERDGESDRLAVWMAAVNPILDPWVYILLRRSVVKRLVKLAKSVCFRKTQKNVEIVLTNPSFTNDSPQFVRGVRDTESNLMTDHGQYQPTEMDLLLTPKSTEKFEKSDFEVYDVLINSRVNKNTTVYSPNNNC